MSITPAPYCIPYVVTASVPRMKWMELIWAAAMFRNEASTVVPPAPALAHANTAAAPRTKKGLTSPCS